MSLQEIASKQSCTGRRSDKKPPLWTQMLDFLHQHRAETLKFLRPNIKKNFRERGGSGGAQRVWCLRKPVGPYVNQLVRT